MKSIRLELIRVSKIFRSNGKTPIVKDVSLSIEGGTVLSLCGENGSGKTTILKMICGLIEPTEGRITLNGFDLSKNRRQALQQLGAVLEGSRSFHWQLTPVQNLEYFGVLRGLEYGYLKDRIHLLTEIMGFERYKNISSKNLSRGFQQRLAIAIALLSDPTILLLDEPTIGLDRDSWAKTADLINTLGTNDGRIILLATHDTHFARKVSSRIVQIHKGQLVRPVEKKCHMTIQKNEKLFFSIPLEIESNTCSLLSYLSKKEDVNASHTKTFMD